MIKVHFKAVCNGCNDHVDYWAEVWPRVDSHGSKPPLPEGWRYKELQDVYGPAMIFCPKHDDQFYEPMEEG